VRIWDLPAGYLNRQSLLGEHRELHGLYRIHTLGLRGYSQHPETVRWTRALSGLVQRHRQLGAEMALRGYVDRSPLASRARHRAWPATFIDPPARQLQLLREKYVSREPGRIPLPRTVHAIWAQHKYSVMARDPRAYRAIGRRVARLRGNSGFDDLALELTLLLREEPAAGRLANAVEHMWGYVSRLASADEREAAARGAAAMLQATQRLAMQHREPYLVSSTALSELAVFAS